ncbi:hypothetical protein SESBI_30492 [Sesbania bispinosa]|nr:hypothetical protein SESBI_30492 [Sesbania bispinosa]
MSNLLVGEDGIPHFPLFWSLEPRRVSRFDFDQLSFDDKIDVAFLRNSAPIDCGFLLENEDLPARLRQSLDKMPPKVDVPRTLVNEKAMRRWLKKAGGDPGAQASESKPASSTNERRKKQKLDVQGDAQSKMKSTEEKQPVVQVTPPIPQPQTSINPSASQTQLGAHAPSGSQLPSSSLPSSVVKKWWALFNNFEGLEGSEVNSIFDRRFPVEQLIAQDFNKKEDRSRVNKVGMRNRKLRLLSPRPQTIAALKKALHEAKTSLSAAEETNKSYEVKYAEMETKYSIAVTEQTKLKKDLDDAVVEKEKLTQDLADVVARKKKQLAEEKAKSDLDLDALQKEIAIQHARGFHKVIAQVQCLNPTIGVEGVGVFKKIIDGKLVDESKDDEE